MPKQLEPLEFPEILSNVWEWFIEISDGRTCSDTGSNPLTWQDISAWSDLMDVYIEPREVKVIKQLDNLLFKTK